MPTYAAESTAQRDHSSSRGGTRLGRGWRCARRRCRRRPPRAACPRVSTLCGRPGGISGEPHRYAGTRVGIEVVAIVLGCQQLVVWERFVAVVVIDGHLATVGDVEQQPPPWPGGHGRRDFSLLPDQFGDRLRDGHQPRLITGPEPQLGNLGGDGEREHCREPLPALRAKLGQLLNNRIKQPRGFGGDRASSLTPPPYPGAARRRCVKSLIVGGPSALSRLNSRSSSAMNSASSDVRRGRAGSGFLRHESFLGLPGRNGRRHFLDASGVADQEHRPAHRHVQKCHGIAVVDVYRRIHPPARLEANRLQPLGWDNPGPGSGRNPTPKSIACAASMRVTFPGVGNHFTWPSWIECPAVPGPFGIGYRSPRAIGSDSDTAGSRWTPISRR